MYNTVGLIYMRWVTTKKIRPCTECDRIFFIFFLIKRNCIKIPGKLWPSSGRRRKSSPVSYFPFQFLQLLFSSLHSLTQSISISVEQQNSRMSVGVVVIVLRPLSCRLWRIGKHQVNCRPLRARTVWGLGRGREQLCWRALFCSVQRWTSWLPTVLVLLKSLPPL